MLKLLLILSALLASSVASAGVDVPLSKAHDDCMDASGGVTVEMLDCMAAETERQDQRLNRNYRELIGQLNAARKQELVAAQRAWLKFRELNCNFYADPDGGSLATVSSAGCVLTMTALRAGELEDLKAPE